MSFIPDPEDAYFQDIQQRVARSIIGAVFGVAASAEQPQVGLVPLDHQYKHIAMLAELKFKTALRDLSRQTGGKLFERECRQEQSGVDPMRRPGRAASGRTGTCSTASRFRMRAQGA